ncbi:unnamed protein product [Mycena citricolor]|uniref:Phosphatidylinositol 4-kinase n=1 Tax=Mycena citricolor TaxID=2018698 RepID=A0AAD2HSW5_9AGAR|nr:unnamed protein product [Mycena citricolor]CAK5281548.1 unnamed protein product [Mycena citricolor]
MPQPLLYSTRASAHWSCAKHSDHIMPDRSGYEPLSASDSNALDEDGDTSPDAPPARGRPRRARMGSVDLSGLDTAFKQWTATIASKLKLQNKKTKSGPSKRQIYQSVFEPTVADPDTESEQPVKTLDHKEPMTQAEFNALVQSVKSAIGEGIHPKMIVKGSSGSYFARAKNAADGRVHTVAVFKPKDEEPYGRLNPKTTKWLHRQLRWIIPFGRACLIPNLSYISPAFFYDWLDRSAAKKGKPLPDKIGSMQFFLTGYQDASEFLRKHPWPGRSIADTFDDSTHRTSNLSKRFTGALSVVCGKTGDADDDLYDEPDYEEERLFDVSEAGDSRPFYWSQALQAGFREELEKLVILDYLMLNTDRGADNYMIKYCEAEHEKSLVDVAPSRDARPQMPTMSQLRQDGSPQVHFSPSNSSMGPSASASSIPGAPLDYTRRPHIHIAAIDNSLSFPHEHPQGWRNYTYGPLAVIGRPFSDKTRKHFLPLLTSTEWWEETTFQLLKIFSVDPDFHPKMFAVGCFPLRQLAVIKGQAWNIVQCLRHDDEGCCYAFVCAHAINLLGPGPLELTRRSKVLVWDDEIEIDDDERTEIRPAPSSPRLSIASVPLPRRTRSRSSGSEFPPPMMHRMSSEASGVPRPVPFSARFKRVHPGTQGILVLEHLERLDAVEASLRDLGVDESEEVDVGESSSTPVAHPSLPVPTSPFSPPSSPPLPTVPETASSDEDEEEDVAMLSKSMTAAEGHQRWGSHMPATPEWIHPGVSAKRTVVVERLETVSRKPLCSCW